MSKINCFKKAGLQDLQDKADALIAKGTPEREAVSKVAKEHFDAETKAITESLNAIRKTAKLKPITPSIDQQAPPPPEPPDTPGQGEAPLSPETGNRQTIEKLQEESKLDDTLKEAIEDFEKYTIRRQSQTQSEARRTIDRLGRDEALRKATSALWVAPMEQKIALLSELAEQYSTEFRDANKKGDATVADTAYGNFMAAMDALSKNITDSAQALSYLNLVGRMFETKTGAVRFAQRQIDDSREGAMKNHQNVKLTIERVLEEFDKLPKDEFLKSKKVQDLIRSISGKASGKTMAKQKLDAATERLKNIIQEMSTLGIAYDPKSTAKKQVELTKALIGYIQAVIENFVANSVDYVKNIKTEVTGEVKKFIAENGITVKDKDLNDLITPEIEAFQRSTRYTQPITKFEKDDAVTKISDALLPKNSEGTRGLSRKPAIQQFYQNLVKRILQAEPNRKVTEPIDVLKEVIANVEKYADVLQEVKDNLEAQGIDTSDIASVFELPFFQKKLAQKVKPEIDKLVDSHFSNLKTAQESIQDKLVKEYGITLENAKAFDNAITKLFNQYATEQKQKLVKKYTPKAKPTAKTAKQRTEFYDKVIQLSNLGAVTDQQLEDTLAQIFGLPAMTPQIALRIEALVDEINKAPEGRFKNNAITRLTDYIAEQQKFNITDYMQASFRAGLFSGISTQGVNLLGNLSNVLELGFILGFTNPAQAARFYKAFANPKSMAKSGMEALEILKTGFDPRMPGDKRRVLEQRPRSFWGIGKPIKGAKQAIDPSLEQQKRFVFRALQAGDMLLSSPIGDALESMFFQRQAKKMGLKGAEATKYIREQMGFTPENIAKKSEQAKKEAATGTIPNDKNSITLRTYELIEQGRNPDVVQKAKEYASQQIMTNTPTGYIGIVAQALNTLIGKIPVLSTLIPVVNFAGNAMNRGIQYMPHTVLVREAFYAVTKKAKGEDFRTQWKDFMDRTDGDFDTEMRLRRAAVGLITTAMMLALLSDDEEDKNVLSGLLGKTVKIHGSGPGTQFNRQKNFQKTESGWQPYSIQIGEKYIPFKNYPGVNVLLASIGEWNDAVKYGKLSRKDAGERFGYALMGSVKVLAEMGFFTSLNTLLGAFLEGDAKALDVLTKTGQGFLTPNFQRDVARLFDNKVYSKGNIQESITRSIPVVNAFLNEPIVNALGEPIEKNWWDRLALWKSESYSKYEPVWKTNNDKKYYFPVPTRFSIEEKFNRPITTKEYNEYFRLRGEEILKEWTPEMAKLSPEKYKDKVDRITRFSDYKALVRMGVMKSDVMKEIRFQLDDVNEIKRGLGETMKQIFE